MMEIRQTVAEYLEERLGGRYVHSRILVRSWSDYFSRVCCTDNLEHLQYVEEEPVEE
jgi:hypothetical protein